MGVFDYVEHPAVLLKKLRGLVTHSAMVSFPSRSFYRTPIRRLRYRLKRCPVYFYDAKTIENLAAEAGFARMQLIKIRGAGMDSVSTFFV
ncbi:MAG TPA: hypothetical protein VMO81_00240 [Aestuariivirgaceae bacterium]|nr:hypothetical protein [Aestuariivirgaceae bacterium]